MRNAASTQPDALASEPVGSGATTGQASGRRVIDAPIRAFHWLFALSFTGAWLTAESESWRDVHVTLGYAFAGLLLFRLIYGLAGPRQARLSQIWHRVSGLSTWLGDARAGRVDWARLATLGLGTAMLLLIVIGVPLVLAGYATHRDWLGMEDALGEVHESFANVALALVLAHLTLIAGLSAARHKNLARPMLTGRMPGRGPDLIKSNRAGLATLLLAAYLGLVGWQVSIDLAEGSTTSGAQDHRISHDGQERRISRELRGDSHDGHQKRHAEEDE